MKRKILAGAAAAAMTFGVAATTVEAGPPAGAGGKGKPAGIECQQHGHALLRSNGAPPKVVEALLPGLSLAEVLALHRTDPAAAAGVLGVLGLDPGPCADA